MDNTTRQILCAGIKCDGAHYWVRLRSISSVFIIHEQYAQALAMEAAREAASKVAITRFYEGELYVTERIFTDLCLAILKSEVYSTSTNIKELACEIISACIDKGTEMWLAGLYTYAQPLTGLAEEDDDRSEEWSEDPDEDNYSRYRDNEF